MYTCKHCKKEFIPKYKIQKKSDPLYCSPKCYHESTKTGRVNACKQCNKPFYVFSGRIEQEYCSIQCRSIYKKITKVCPTCKKSFTVYKSIKRRYIFCSVECKPKVMIKKFCQRCGKAFKTERKDIKHCSEICRRPPIYINCFYCDKTLRIIPSMKNIKRFCSFSCYRKYCGETSIEKITREALGRLGVNYTQEYQIGTYCVDFYLHDNNTCLEVDGEYWHIDSKKDQKRDSFLKKLGHKIIRIKEQDIMNSDNVDKLILGKLNIYPLTSATTVQRHMECKGGASTVS